MLRDQLWSGKTISSARNTMAVNLIRLRKILEGLDSCKISSETGYLKFEYDPAVIYIDYCKYLEIIKDNQEISRNKLLELLKIFYSGPFLDGISFEGIDKYKASVSDTATELLRRFEKTLNPDTDSELILEVCSAIFIFDPLDEEALIKKCQVLLKSGKHSLAVNCFEKFGKQYFDLYGEEFKKSYKEIFGVDPA